MTTATPPAAEPLLLTAQQAAAKLGISYEMVRFAIRNGDLPARRLHPRGKSYYLCAADLEAFARASVRDAAAVRWPPRDE